VCDQRASGVVFIDHRSDVQMITGVVSR
jgi:hypothetical protein